MRATKSDKKQIVQSQETTFKLNTPEKIYNDSQKKQYARGHWSKEQQQKYLNFLRNKYHVMKNSQLRYHYRIFNDMSAYIGTRSSMQCKSHHQKVLKKNNSNLQQIVFISQNPYQCIQIGKQEKKVSQYQAVIIGLKGTQMSQKNPWVLVSVDNSFIIMLDERFIQVY